jgi:hypothetical protein
MVVFWFVAPCSILAVYLGYVSEEYTASIFRVERPSAGCSSETLVHS